MKYWRKSISPLSLSSLWRRDEDCDHPTIVCRLSLNKKRRWAVTLHRSGRTDLKLKLWHFYFSFASVEIKEVNIQFGCLIRCAGEKRQRPCESEVYNLTSSHCIADKSRSGWTVLLKTDAFGLQDESEPDHKAQHRIPTLNTGTLTTVLEPVLEEDAP